MNITIRAVDHKDQRYPTCGDWQFDAEGNLTITVSKLNDWRHEMLLAVHELYEAILCEHAGITQELVDKFDMDFEAKRASTDDSEPGDHPDAPYRLPHFRATNVERQLADHLAVDWQEYETEINSLP